MAKNFNLSVVFRVIDKATKPIRKIGNSLKKLTGPIKKATRSFKELGKTLKKVGKRMTSIGKSMALKLTLPLTLIAGLATRSAIQFESAFTGVRKTVEATEKEFAALKKGLEELSLEIPIVTQELFGIAEAAGQLGIKQKDILTFTKVMADLGATTNLTANEAATALARFANVIGLSSDDFDKLGSVIVDLGNNMATTEAEIVEMGMRLVGAAKTVGLTSDQVMSLSAALSSVGIRAEAGGTAFSMVMKKIAKEIGSGSEEMQGFAKVSGMSIAEFEKAWKEDAAGTLITFTEGIGKLQKRGINVNKVLDVLGFEGIRISDSLLRAAGSGNKFREALKLGSKAWKENIALTKEANLRYKTAESQLIMAKNRAILLAVSFGEVLVPVLIKVIEFLEPIVDWLGKLSPTTKTIIVIIGALVAAIGPLLIAIGFIASGIGAVMAIGAPVAIIIGAITAAFLGLSAAIVQVIRYWEDLKFHFSNMGVKDWFKFVFDIGKFLTNPTGIGKSRAPSGEQAGAGIAESKSQTDINIKLTADSGTSATIEKVKSRGDSAVNVASVGYVGAH